MKKKCLATLLAVIMVVSLLSGTAWAADTSGSCGDGVTWSYNDGTLTIQGTGPMDDCGGWHGNVELKQPWYDYRKEIHTVTISDGVTSIGRNAFGLNSTDVFLGSRSNLTSVTIPNSVTSIGDSAFGYCRRLTSITIPDSVTSIGRSAFYGCTSLTSVTIPSGVTTISASTFATCESLTSVTIPNCVTTIEMFAFASCKSLTSVNIPSSVTTIEDGAFDNCSNLADISYGGSESQWKQITINDGNGALTRATIHYNSTDSDKTPTPAQPTAPSFTDVSADVWYADPVAWAVGKGITNGTTTTTFSPAQDCTHAQILTFLHRAAGKPTASAKAPVTVAAAYADAVDWAYEKGMIDDSFDPSAPCTRSQAVQYIWQALGEPDAKASSFTDVPAGASYAKAVDWAVEKGVTNGDGGADTFAPDKVCSRGHIVTFLYRAYEG